VSCTIVRTLLLTVGGQRHAGPGSSMVLSYGIGLALPSMRASAEIGCDRGGQDMARDGGIAERCVGGRYAEYVSVCEGPRRF
jgi:hypothetical protein